MDSRLLTTGWGVIVKTPTSTWSGRGSHPTELIPARRGAWLVPAGCTVRYTYVGKGFRPAFNSFIVPEGTFVKVFLKRGRTGSGDFRYRLRLQIPSDAPVHLPGLRSSAHPCPRPTGIVKVAAATNGPDFVVLRQCAGGREIRGVATHRGNDGNLRVIPVLPPHAGDSFIVIPGDVVEPTRAASEELAAAALMVADNYYLNRLGDKAIAGVKAWLESQASVGANHKKGAVNV